MVAIQVLATSTTHKQGGWNTFLTSNQCNATGMTVSKSIVTDAIDLITPRAARSASFSSNRAKRITAVSRFAALLSKKRCRHSAASYSTDSDTPIESACVDHAIDFTDDIESLSEPSLEERAKRKEARLKRWTSSKMRLTSEFANLYDDQVDASGSIGL